MSEGQQEINVSEVEVTVEVRNIIEALVFASDEPMSVRMIRGLMDEVNKDRLPHEQLAVNAEIIRKAVGELNKGYARMGSGFRISEIAGGFVYTTLEHFASWVGRLAKERARRRLSPTAVETLAIIAYKQPITKTEVEFIRGVNVDYIINALLEKDLIHITGRQNSPGRPLLYGTTPKFLEHFGLNELTDLPKPREIAELISETEIEVDRRLLAEQQELEFRESLENKLEGHEGTAKKQKEKERTPRAPKVKVPDEVTAERLEKERAEKNTEPAKESEAAVPEAPPAAGETAAVILPEPADETVLPAPDDGPAEPLAEPAPEIAEPAVVETPADEPEPAASEMPDADVTEQTAPKPLMVFGEEGVRTSESRHHTQEDDRHPADAHGHPEEGAHGWSKWKNKVKSFFKKLFG